MSEVPLYPSNVILLGPRRVYTRDVSLVDETKT